ncbi:hypothetical protein PENTCL1PPCAC_29290, partial [Pristionchus entomophagus]
LLLLHLLQERERLLRLIRIRLHAHLLWELLHVLTSWYHHRTPVRWSGHLLHCRLRILLHEHHLLLLLL